MAADITESVPVSPWWGWAPPTPGGSLSEGTLAVLAERLGIDAEAARRPGVLDAAPATIPSDADLAASALTEAAVAALVAAAPTGAVAQDAASRVAHAAGKNTVDLLQQRAGTPLGLPDAVVRPGERAEVAAVLAACVAHGVAVVPFGGGSSVVGGVAPLSGEHHAVIALDLTGLSRLLDLNERDRTAMFEAGVRGPDLERQLADRGYTLGHIPQSHQQATLGGYAATRSAGQASTGYGAIAELITAIRIETPTGPLALGGRAPASAAGPDLRHLVIGSEGTIGVITEVTVAVKRRPTTKAYGAWAFPSFEAGAEAIRALAQDGAAGDLPDVCRLSDEEETELTLAQSGGTQTEVLRRWLRSRGIETPALLLGVWEGSGSAPKARLRRARKILRAHGAVSATSAPAAAWDRGRFSSPRLRDELLTIGVLVDTLETAATWTNLAATHTAVAAAIRGALAAGPAGGGVASAVQGHVSHVYRDGASLYYTFIAKAEHDPVAQYERVKRAANEAIVASGATITHHHAVGTEHAAHLPAEIGEQGVRILRAVKRELDPTGIMNPGKLI
ncbi:FAD-binding oxidoreductase [Leucobacter aridicollis]|uniref:FAD-binding oxidoreductase n=1 Tax=Leucobacter aridicollis TaxID=283878 RepID=UPI0021080C3B|nr:FAD-binding oxidoreductase [Leucobacter aridicollis]UTX54354.1 FAD-binding oxidoreductase [Leucobacter aridicollis]